MARLAYLTASDRAKQDHGGGEGAMAGGRRAMAGGRDFLTSDYGMICMDNLVP